MVGLLRRGAVAPPRFSWVLAGLVLVSLTIGGTLAAPRADAATGRAATTPVRVMVVGDSISQGFGGDSTWRYWFWREANRQGRPVDFVGPHRGFLPGHGTRYESAGLYFDRDHAARAGSTVSYHLARIDDLMVRYTPQVVVVELGINDVRAGRSGETVAHDLQRLMERVWSHAPGARVLLAELPVYPHDSAMDAAAVRANSLLADRYDDDSRVMLAHNRTDQHLRWNPVVFTFDGLHPNATGQTMLAQRFAEAMRRGGLLDQEPKIYQVRTWRPNVRPQVLRSGRAVTIDWSAGRTQVKMGSVRIRLSRRGTGVVHQTPWYAVQKARISRQLARGTYNVWLVPRRGSMVGVPSSPVVVTIR
jgi:lysophospholipase L1-like esterase